MRKSLKSQKIAEQELKLLLLQGEGLSLEYKERYSSKIVQDIVGFANSRGGHILLGVADSGHIVGEKLTNSLKAEIHDLAKNCDPEVDLICYQLGQVVVINVREGSYKPYSCSTGYYKRFDAVTQKLRSSEINSLFREYSDLSFEEKTVKSFSLKEISINKVKAFLNESHVDLKVDARKLKSFLMSLNLLKEDKVKVAGILMFASDMSKYLSQSQIFLVAFKGSTRTHIYDKKYIKDDLLTQFNEAILFCQKHLNESAIIKGINRQDQLEIPLEVLREVIANAIIHRDYSLKGQQIDLSIFPDRVEVVSPGGLLSAVKLKDLGKKSVRRNELIADLFHRMH